MLAFHLQVLLGFFKHFSIEFLSFLEVFLSELRAQFNLIVEHFPDLLNLLYLDLLLLLDLLFVQLLSELLDFAPLIVTNVGWHVLNLQFLSVFLLSDLDMRRIATEFSGDFSCSISILLLALTRLCLIFSLMTW